MHPAIFLDRDGVIIENRHNYVRSWADVSIFPFALAALAQISNFPYKIVIITNQSAVGRGIITIEAAQEINQRLVKEIEKAGGRVDGVFMCPHAPQENCTCRKPKPGLLLTAAQEMGLDLSQSILIGDAASDLLAGQAAGVKRTLLVRTGRGSQQIQSVASTNLGAFQVYDTLAEAVASIM